MIVDIYLSKQVIRFSAIILVITTSLFFCYTLASITSEIVVGSLTLNTIFTLATLHILTALPFLLPTAYYFGIIATLTQLHRTSEALVLGCLGWSEWRLARTIIATGIVLTLIVVYATVWLRPWTYSELYNLEKQAILGNSKNHIKIGNFASLNNKWTLNVAVNGEKAGELVGIFIHNRPQSKEQDKEIVVLAERGTLSTSAAGNLYRLQLHNGQIHQFKGQNGSHQQHDFDELQFPVEESNILSASNRRRAHTTKTLMRSNARAEAAEFHWRLSFPLATLLLGVLAVPISRAQPKQGGYRPWVLAIAVYAAILYSSSIATSWVENAVIAPLPGIWALWLAFSLIAIILYRRQRPAG